MPLDRGWILEPLCDFHFKIRETKNALSQSTPLNGLTAVKQHFQSNVCQERPSMIHLLVQWVVKMGCWTKRGLTYISPQATRQWLSCANQLNLQHREIFPSLLITCTVIIAITESLSQLLQCPHMDFKLSKSDLLSYLLKYAFALFVIKGRKAPLVPEFEARSRSTQKLLSCVKNIVSSNLASALIAQKSTR